MVELACKEDWVSVRDFVLKDLLAVSTLHFKVIDTGLGNYIQVVGGRRNIGRGVTPRKEIPREL